MTRRSGRHLCAKASHGLCMKWHQLLSGVNSSFFSLTYFMHVWFMAINFFVDIFLFYILYFQLVFCSKSDYFDFSD